MYSEHGFDALMRPVFGSVCHELIVVSYWTPGSAHSHAAARDLLQQVARVDRRDDGAVGARGEVELLAFAAASMNASLTRTELFAFWYWIEAQSGESSDMS